jgi:spore photoproduct lyase
VSVFDAELNRIKEEFKRNVRLSFQMETELDQILKFLMVNNTDVESFMADFCRDQIKEDTTVSKNETKKLLEALRDRAIKETVPKRSEAGSSGGTGDKREITAWVEEDIMDDPRAVELYKSSDKVIPIRHYKDIFNAKGHDFKKEKHSGNFIVARNKDAMVYSGAPFCQSFGNEHFYYASCVKNCIFDCDYCFLQGLYPCGYPVYFINLEDYFEELDRLLEKFPVYVCISYDTDLLAMESKLHYVEKWVSYAQKRPKLKVEIRTKSGNSSIFKEYKKLKTDYITENTDNIIFAWTISPKEVTSFAEVGLPAVEKRLDALRAAKDAGFPVRLCFDPMIFHPGWKESYIQLFRIVFNSISAEDIVDASIGVFRISNKLLKRMRDANELSPVTQFPYITENGACHYGDLSKEMVEFAKEELGKYLPVEKIYAWEGNE